MECRKLSKGNLRLRNGEEQLDFGSGGLYCVDENRSVFVPDSKQVSTKDLMSSSLL